jgi:hypothetical protein
MRSPRLPAIARLGTIAVIAALGTGLLVLRGMAGGHTAPASTSAMFPKGVPSYYAALTQPASGGPDQVQVRETLTGGLTATIHPPQGTTFAGITGAADDRTWVAETQPGTLEGPGTPESQRLRPRTWYLIQLAPGSPQPARLSKLPIPVTAHGTDVDAIALSPDGAQLAVAYAPQPNGWPPWLDIYSIANGTRIRQWASNFGQHFGAPNRYAPLPLPSAMRARSSVGRFVVRPGLDDRDDEERVTPGEVAVEPVAQE